jgi:hypothetical protein
MKPEVLGTHHTQGTRHDFGKSHRAAWGMLHGWHGVRRSIASQDSEGTKSPGFDADQYGEAFGRRSQKLPGTKLPGEPQLSLILWIICDWISASQIGKFHFVHTSYLALMASLVATMSRSDAVDGATGFRLIFSLEYSLIKLILTSCCRLRTHLNSGATFTKLCNFEQIVAS